MEDIKDELKKELFRLDDRLLERYSIERCLVLLDTFHGNSYRTLPAGLKNIFENIESSSGKKAASSYKKLLLATLIERSRTKLQSYNLPEDVEELTRKGFERILGETAIQSDEYYDQSKDLFMRDLALANLRLLPVGCEMAEEVRIGRRYLITGGFRQFFRALLFAVTKTHSLNPLYYQRHLDDRCLAEFDMEGVTRCCLRLARMCERNPKIAGIAAASWIFDPQIPSISPRLAWNRRLHIRNGAIFFDLGSTESAMRLATRRSETRRRLFGEGKYKPHHYLVLWPRSELIAWATRQQRKLDLGVEASSLESKAKELEVELERSYPGFSRKFPIELYVDEIASSPPYASYRYTSPRLAAAFEQIEKEFGKRALAFYHRLAVTALMKESLREIKNKALPASVIALYREWFVRIFEDLSRLEDTYYDHSKDFFRRDLAVAALNLIPIGFLAEISGLELKKFLSCSPALVPARLLTIAAIGGWRPFYYIHLEMRYLKKYFNPKGWNFNYRRIAELLEMNPRIKGIAGSSWFYDPKLQEISPHLAYIRKVPQAYGAHIFEIEATEQTKRLATANSPLRMKLFLEGKYKPSQYILIWPRGGILRWARENREDPGNSIKDERANNSF